MDNIEIPIEKILNVSVNDIMSVYSGKLGCACGCRGKHTTASKYIEMNSVDRGYPVKPEEVNDKTVNLLFDKVITMLKEAVQSNQYKNIMTNDGFVSADTDTRSYVLYFKKGISF